MKEAPDLPGTPPRRPGRWSLAFLLLVVLGVPGCSDNATGPGDGDQGISWRAGGYTFSSFRSGARGEVHFSVYLPPGWSPEGTGVYPLIIYLHGQGGTERGFPSVVAAEELNGWIEAGLVPPFVLVAPRGDDIPDRVQWYHTGNERLLTSESPNELRSFCWTAFRAGGDPGRISVHGQSRGASGVLFFTLNHFDKFASGVANAFVSDYVLDDYMAAATLHRDAIVASGIRLRMTIGSDDAYVHDLNRTGSWVMDRHLTDLGIPHEFQVLPGVPHGLNAQWHYVHPDGKPNGLHELQFHAGAWRGDGPPRTMYAAPLRGSAPPPDLPEPARHPL